jgi:corrinoid protein of di/trimethylamine methyltransferase
VVKVSEIELIERLKKSIIRCDEETTRIIAKDILKAGIDPLKVIEGGVSPAAKIVGEKFERGEYFLPRLMLAAEAMKVATRILTEEISAEKKAELESRILGRVVIATVSGDVHDIGKNIVSILLKVNGFHVHDLGRDIDSMEIIERALEVEADIIALSALMTTTMLAQKEVIDILKAMGIREKFIVMVGGAPTTKEWAAEIGADGWAETAEEAVRLAQELIKRRRGSKK